MQMGFLANTKRLKIVNSRSQYTTISRSRVRVQNLTESGLPNFAGEIGEVEFFSNKQTNSFTT